MEEISKIIREAKHVMFITGAGISVPSGLSTYRGKNGLYSNSLIPPELLMSSFVWKFFPRLIWKQFHKAIKNNVKHNIIHHEIAKLELFIPKITVLTQNVDGLHRKAGSSNVIEIHGTFTKLVCKCGYEDDNPDFANLPALPRCPKCANILRPPVVLFGESLPDQAINSYHKAFEDFPDVIIVIGTTASFDYILNPINVAIQHNIPTVVIDPSPTKQLTRCMFVIKDNAEKALPRILKKTVGMFGIPKLAE